MNQPQIEITVYRAIGKAAEPLSDLYSFEDVEEALVWVRESVLGRIESSAKEGGILVVGIHWWDAQPK